MRQSDRQSGHYDRDSVVAATDLPVLLDRIMGPRHGRRSATWACPDPGHGHQTGRTPPVSSYLAHGREQRWHCHGCGADGTAIDLIMLTQNCDFRGALQFLAQAAGIPPEAGAPFSICTATAFRPPAVESPPEPCTELIDYVLACEATLDTDDGRDVRAWLAGRGFQDPVLTANHVGADPGPSRLSRHPGLPRRGPAAVFPVLDRHGTPIYLQVRYLQPRDSKYGSPTSDLVGPSPRLAVIRPPIQPTDRQIVVVCEGIPDGLTAAQAGFRACAVLGAGNAGGALAADLARRYPGRQLVLAFDADAAGRAATDRLTRALSGQGVRVTSVRHPPGAPDLNDWARLDPEALSEEIRNSAQPQPSRSPAIRSEEPPR